MKEVGKNLKCKVARVDSILQGDIFPLNSESGAIVHVFNSRVIAQPRIEIGHQWRNVLSGS